MPTADELLDAAAVLDLAACLAKADPNHPPVAVRGSVEALPGRGLRERTDLIRDALLRDLPADYPGLARVVRAALADPACTGWMIWPVTEAVAARVLEVPDRAGFEDALTLLAELTPRLTAEFAIRRLLNADPHRALDVVRTWTSHTDEHVRRLASEGTRPRLPWAVRVPAVLADPDLTLPILHALYRDPSDYVRRSVANHLNDISHADPDLAVDVATAWSAAPDAHTPRLVRHALRTAIKAGHPRALALLGFVPAVDLAVTGPTLATTAVTVGGELRFHFTVENLGAEPLRLAIDYVVHYRKANGKTAPKVYKLTTTTLEPGAAATITRSRSFAPISTRVFHAGAHALELRINGRPGGTAAFDLALPG